jgi:hypothetical protein
MVSAFVGEHGPEEIRTVVPKKRKQPDYLSSLWDRKKVGGRLQSQQLHETWLPISVVAGAFEEINIGV